MTDLKITQQELENRELRLIVEVPDQRVEREMRKLARKLAREYRIPGFRPGKAPYHVIVGRIGRENMLEQVAEELGIDIYREALAETGIEPAAPAILLDTQYDPLIFEFEVPLQPEVDPGDYRDIRIPLETPSEETIAAKVEETLEDLRSRYSAWADTDEPIAYEDLVTLGIKVEVEGEVVLENDDWDFVPSEEDYTLAPDFDSALIGLKKGDAKSFTIHFPEDSGSAWAGKDGVVEVVIHNVQREKLPELTDEFIQEVSDFTSLEEARQSLAENIRAQLTAEAESDYIDKVREACLSNATIRFPAGVLEQELEALADEQESYYRSLGFESTSELLRLQGKSKETYHQELKPIAELRLKERLFLDAVAEREKIQVSEYELQQFLKTNFDEEDVSKWERKFEEEPEFREYMAQYIKRNKALKLLEAIARGEEVPAPGEHPVVEEPPTPEEPEATEEAPAARAEIEEGDDEATTETAPAPPSQPEAEDTLQTSEPEA